MNAQMATSTRSDLSGAVDSITDAVMVMEHARCLCARDGESKLLQQHYGCPFHGYTSFFPKVPYVLTWNDKRLLHSLRVDPEDSAAIQDVRQADEDRFKS